MTWIVVLILTLTSGKFIQENTTAASYEDCKAKIGAWVEAERPLHADGSMFPHWVHQEMKALLAAIAMLFSGSATANTITITGVDPGGEIATYAAFWDRIAQSGDKLVIDGACISACTFFLGTIPLDRVCITGRGSLGFHEASRGDTPNPTSTKIYVRLTYPDWVQQWIKGQGGLTEEIKVMYPEDMKGHIALCPGSSYPTVTPEELIEPVLNIHQ